MKRIIHQTLKKYNFWKVFHLNKFEQHSRTFRTASCRVAVTFLLKIVIADTMETKSWHPIDLEVITSEKQKTDVGLTGVFDYKKRMVW